MREAKTDQYSKYNWGLHGQPWQLGLASNSAATKRFHPKTLQGHDEELTPIMLHISTCSAPASVGSKRGTGMFVSLVYIYSRHR